MGDRYLVTGGAGFIGSNFVRMALERGFEVTNLDALTYAGVRATVDELDAYPNHRFVLGDVRDRSLLAKVLPGHDVVVHFAAETHVDRSIVDPIAFLEANVVGTGALIDAAYRTGIPRLVHVSTDEVYGSIARGFADEQAILAPSSPYSASKAGADLLARSYGVTYDYPVIVTRCTNNYGPFQFPEKVIPLFVTNLILGRNVPLYGDGYHERDWLHVDDHCSAIMHLIEAGTLGEIYNIGAYVHVSNLDLARMIVAFMGRDESVIEQVTDRPGHDRRYAVNSSKVRALGWEPSAGLEERLRETIEWYRSREDWWRPIKATE